MSKTIKPPFAKSPVTAPPGSKAPEEMSVVSEAPAEKSDSEVSESESAATPDASPSPSAEQTAIEPKGSGPAGPGPAASGPITIVQLVHIDETGDSYYRMRWPARDLAGQDSNLRVINLQHNAAERYDLIEQADLAVIYQSHDIDLLPVIKKRRMAGKKTLVEYNDNFYAPATPSPVQEGWSSPLLWTSYEMMVQAADALLVTGPGLLELFSRRFPQKRIEVLENHLPFRPKPFDAVWQERSALLAEGKIVIGWAGSVGHMADLIAIAPALRSLVARFPNVTIAMMGNESIPEVLGLPPQRFRFTHWGTMEQYFNFLRTLHIGIAAALDTPYNRCRSDIKAVEFSSQGVVPILAEILPYGDFLKATSCLSFSSIESLEQIIAQLISRPDEIRERAAAVHAHVTEKRVGIDHRRRLDLYREFLPATLAPLRSTIPPGYHEVAGTPETDYRSNKALIAANRLVQDKQIDSATAVIKQALEQNPFSSELTLQYLKLLRAKKPAIPQLPQLIDQAVNSFPSDLRFLLLKAGTTNSSTEQGAVWQTIIDRVKANPIAARFFQKDLLRNLSTAVPRNHLLIPIAEQAATIYPTVLTLRIELGRILEATGKDQQALEHFRAALTLTDIVNANVETPASDRKYVLTWCEALEARIKRSGTP